MEADERSLVHSYTILRQLFTFLWRNKLSTRWTSAIIISKCEPTPTNDTSYSIIRTSVIEISHTEWNSGVAGSILKISSILTQCTFTVRSGNLAINRILYASTLNVYIKSFSTFNTSQGIIEPVTIRIISILTSLTRITCLAFPTYSFLLYNPTIGNRPDT